MLEPGSALYIFILETYVNYSTRLFIFGKDLFIGNIDPTSPGFKSGLVNGPMSIHVRKSLEERLIGDYRIRYYINTQGILEHINIDWLDIIDDYRV